MKLKSSLFLLSALFFALSLPVFASGGSGGAVSTPRPDAKDDFVPTKSLRGELVKLTATTITIRDEKGRETTLSIDAKTKFRSEDKAAFSGKTKLEANDLTAGLNVRVNYREADKTAVTIKALKKKS